MRVDSSIYSGVEIPYFYDPMLAKLICWGPDRPSAIDRMKRVLSEFVVEGIRTNVELYQRILEFPDFRAGRLDTGFLARLEADAR